VFREKSGEMLKGIKKATENEALRKKIFKSAVNLERKKKWLGEINGK